MNTVFSGIQEPSFRFPLDSRIWFLPITGNVFICWSAILRSFTSKNFIQKLYPNLRKLNLRSCWQIYQSRHTHTHTHSHEWITPFKIIQAQVNLSFHSGTCQLSTVSHSWHADSARQAAPVASHPQPEPLLFHLVHRIMESQNSRD